MADPAKRKDRDLYFTSWGNGSLDPSDIMLPTLRTGGRGNSAGFSNAEVDQLLDAAETELDPAKRKAMYHEAQSIVNAAAPLDLPVAAAGPLRRVEPGHGLDSPRRTAASTCTGPPSSSAPREPTSAGSSSGSCS